MLGHVRLCVLLCEAARVLYARDKIRVYEFMTNRVQGLQRFEAEFVQALE